MRIDKAKLEALAALPDDRLWAAVRQLAASHGLSLPEGTPPHEELERLRTMAKEADRLSLRDAMRLINAYRRGSR